MSNKNKNKALDMAHGLLTDPRVPNFYACVQCGACTSICTAASLDKRYNPRRLVECLISGGDITDYPLENCFSCYCCKYVCRKGNSVADIVKVLKENARLEVNSEDYNSLYECGLCVTVAAHSPDKFPEWGTTWAKIHGEMKKHRSALGLEDGYRKLPSGSIGEIRAIVDRTVNIKRYKEVGGIVEERKKINPARNIYLFRSCIADTHYPGITESVKYIFDRLGIDYIDDPRHSTCTGFAYYADKIPFPTMLAVNARNFALAEEAGYLNIATICQTCYGILIESLDILKSGIGQQVNAEVLSAVKMQFRGDVNIAHVSEILWAQRARLKTEIRHSLDGLRIATHTGCHYAKMYRKYAVPHLLDELVAATGAELVEYAEKDLCCGLGFGHTIEQSRRHLTREIAHRKLSSATEAGADVLFVACPGCQMTLDRNQELIERETGDVIGLPIVNYAQLIALAMGADAYTVVGAQTHSVSLETLLKRIE
ncbi:MAG: heterodisulfide reductase-related iron-sulfur binding cluster [Halobacteriota archaeon]